MSIDQSGRTLGDWISALLTSLHEADPVAYARLHRAVDGRRARIALDGGAVDIRFHHGRLEVARAGELPVDGIGATDGATVLRLLDGTLEVVDALLQGHLRVQGGFDDVARILLAIEILLDAAPRAPALQALAAAWRASIASTPAPSRPRHRIGESERDMLGRLGVLPEDV